jgi:hypothetical protein
VDVVPVAQQESSFDIADNIVPEKIFLNRFF